MQASSSTKAIYCQPCRNNSGHARASYKVDRDFFRQVTVVDQKANGAYVCSCGQCGHRWTSRSPEAQRLYGEMQKTLLHR